jgi:hypothetical protein
VIEIGTSQGRRWRLSVPARVRLLTREALTSGQRGLILLRHMGKVGDEDREESGDEVALDAADDFAV